MKKGPKKSTLNAVRNFIIVQLAAMLAYFGAGLLAHYARIYRGLPIAQYVPFQLAQILAIFGIQGLLIAVIFIRWRKSYLAESEVTLAELMLQPETDDLEFKSTLRWDLKTGKVNRALEKSAMKTVAAFLNSKGGTLVLGVDDTRSVVGLHHDIATLQRTDIDGLETHFTNVFRSMLGPEFRQFVTFSHYPIGDKLCSVVSVQPSSKPVYLRDENNEEFFIRTGNGTTSLKLSEVAAYVDSRFRKWFRLI